MAFAPHFKRVSNPVRIAVPPYFFKYLPPERIDVLTRARFRISQRQAVKDEYEFRPPVSQVARDPVIRKLLEENPTHHDPRVIDHIMENPALKQKMLEMTRSAMRTPDEFGMLCLADSPFRPNMWKEYAKSSTGFVIQFRSLELTRKRILFDRVTYSDEKVPFLTEAHVPGLFFRKLFKFKEEQEWRGLMKLSLCEADGVDPDGFQLYFLYFFPSAIEAIYVMEKCTVLSELTQLRAIDSRYSHVKMGKVEF